MSITNGNGHYPKPKNVLGTELKNCCTDPMTGFYRDGYCRTGADDTGRHTVCILATDEFLAYSKSVGNDLSTPMPQYNFPGVKGGGTSDELKIKLGDFAGPLDLLLFLIKQEQANIFDIPIARITEKYVEYIRLMKRLDISVAADFLVMAATLIEIKSKMLLPRD